MLGMLLGKDDTTHIEESTLDHNDSTSTTSTSIDVNDPNSEQHTPSMSYCGQFQTGSSGTDLSSLNKRKKNFTYVTEELCSALTKCLVTIVICTLYIKRRNRNWHAVDIYTYHYLQIDESWSEIQIPYHPFSTWDDYRLFMIQLEHSCKIKIRAIRSLQQRRGTGGGGVDECFMGSSQSLPSLRELLS